MNAGSGEYGVSAELLSEDETERWGEAEVHFEVINGKITGVYLAELKFFDEPESTEQEESEDPTDYDAFDAYLVGPWFNPANNLTLFIQKNGEAEHGYTFTIQSADDTYVIPVSIARGGALSYTSVRINMQDAVESSGDFLIDGGLLIWSRNDALIEFENATIFTKVQ
ncbi:MAG: hypothetical protein IKS37_05385 [Solobacterium sp.]|nr:hypothetical protein [Solobacterium sp.]